MPERDSLFDGALALADRIIIDVMGTAAEITNGVRSGEIITGVFDDPENVSFAGSGMRVEGSSPVFFVRVASVSGLKRHDTLNINGETFWIDRISPDDSGSCHLWLERGAPPATARRR